jgi:UDP-N-acetylglucosamine--N-acetylmuramyl-(pentapeptide) pyrophosphoryl-undecaprenol N-acetylglucosamine transferase
MNIIIAAAKTGGHVYPAIEVGKKLLSKGNKVFFIGNGSQIEKNALKGLDFEYKEINIDGVRGKSLFNKIFSSINIISKIFTIWKFINKNQIKAMVGFGGFITVPIGIASLISGVKVFTQEQNSVMGSANKLLSKFAVINFLGFPLIKPQKNSKVYGNPVRDSFTKNKTYVAQNNIIKIYITGGSQGSQYLNTILPTCFCNNKFEVEIRHQCGIGKKHGVNQLYEKSNINSVVKEFFDDPSEQVDWCDYVVCRSGALTISEVSSMSKGALMIPLPSAIDNHQLFNAEHIVNSNLGIIHQEKNGVEDLKNLINKINEEKLYKEWQKQGDQKHFHASNQIANAIIENI